MNSINNSVSLGEKLSNLPRKSGVYLFKNNNQIIYIGKAKNLRNRVKSYFQSGRHFDPKLDRLLAKLTDFEIIVTDSEVEALILEANLVKEHKPRYNINLKDDKSYPYIRITNEPFPRIFPTRKIVRDGSKYFGPYTDVQQMKHQLNVIKRIFPVRSCNLKLTPETIANKKYKVCLNYHIKKCRGPCEGFIDQSNYQQMIDHIAHFVAGKRDQIITDLEKEMKSFSQSLQFEAAARIRDQLNALLEFQTRQKIVDPTFKDRDIIATAMNDNDSCCVIFKVRDGKIIGRQHFYLKGSRDETFLSVTSAFLEQYYLKADYIPKEVILPVHLGDEMDLIQKWLSEKRGQKVYITVPKRGPKLKLLDMCRRNAQLLLDELKLQKESRNSSIALQALKEDLNLDKVPNRIEAFDVSNIQGTDPVASMVCFLKALPAKSEYKKYLIRIKSTPDDFKMMYSVVLRRYRRLIHENKTLPDLILIDGGKGQLNAACKALKELDIQDQAIAAIAKRLDEIFIPGIPEAQNIKKHSPGLKLLQRVRDESHRFAVSFHRQRRKKRTLLTELENIPGIGKSKSRILLQYFGSVKNIQAASLENLQEVKGISKKLAEQIHHHFRSAQINKT